MIRPTSQLIFCLFLEQIKNFLPTYNANGEIEVWRNTIPRLVEKFSQDKFYQENFSRRTYPDCNKRAHYSVSTGL